MPCGEQVLGEKVEEGKKIELKIEVEDFGPISGGRISLKPLTLFIGPNNSGKSYAAMLIHSIFEAYTMTFPPRQTTFLRLVDSFAEVAELKKQFERRVIPIIIPIAVGKKKNDPF